MPGELVFSSLLNVHAHERLVFAGPYGRPPGPGMGFGAPFHPPPPIPNFPAASPAAGSGSSGPLSFALSAADTLGVGGNTRKQIERVTQSE